MPVQNDRPTIAQRIAAAPVLHDNSNPLWQGPCGEGPLGGITQSMLVRFLSCRERFRLKYVLGLEPPDRWNKTTGYGQMWHVCEEEFAKGPHLKGIADFGRGYVDTDEYKLNNTGGGWHAKLCGHTGLMCQRHPYQRDEIVKWMNVCAVQFPEYVRYWAEHPDVQNRQPLMQEKVFDTPYTLPSGRVVRLRGKFDSVDLIDGGIWLQENKTKGDIDKLQVERQLRFDLQTMLYLVALRHEYDLMGWASRAPLCGVRYNVIRRPLSGGVGSIRPQAEKRTKKTYTPAETDEQFYERLRRDYIAADPAHWFFRVRAEVSARDIEVFRNTCLDPLLETVCWWYDDVTDEWSKTTAKLGSVDFPPMNYRTPFGVWSALEEGGSTEYDAYLDSGSEAGLRRVHELFTELQ